ncbi:MAG: hypothetical protein P4L85_15750 [Paludisphaera borealis]|uniref:hypothetical protein n=1 Tax=Paludisphaera borealis TaxID=1387353 RepID=UPI00284C382B|nr:hypothetical protein [Paludisphaera borealis]MDR3620805.1 hypothetical protein [Paludisphaera borealis]
MSTGEEEVVGTLEVRGGKIRIPAVRAFVRETHHHRELSFFVPPGSIIRVKDPVKLIIAGPVPRVISAKVAAHMPSARGDIGDHYDAKIAGEEQYPDGLDKPPVIIA